MSSLPRVCNWRIADRQSWGQKLSARFCNAFGLSANDQETPRLQGIPARRSIRRRIIGQEAQEQVSPKCRRFESKLRDQFAIASG